MTPFDVLILVSIVVVLFLQTGGDISFRSKEDEPIIYRCPPSGDPFAGGYFEVPRNSEGEEFVRRVIKATTPGALSGLKPEDLEAFGFPPKKPKTAEDKAKEEAYEAHIANSNSYL